MHKVGTADALATLHPIAGQAAATAVGGGGPDQINLTTAGRCRGQAGRIGWRGRIRRRGGGGGIGDIRIVHAHVVGGIDGLHPVAVVGGGGQAGVVERDAGGRSDLDEARAACPLAAFQAIAGDADVVGCSVPAEIDLRGAYGAGRHAGHRAGRSGVGRPRRRDGGGPIRLDLHQGQHAGVDTEFVEQAAEGITVV